MKIGIDARIIFKRGVGRYIANLVQNLLMIDKKNEYFLYLDKNSKLDDFIDAKNCHIRRLNTGNAFMYEQWYLPRAAAKDKCDILHGTDNTIPFMLPLYKGKSVVTIHDTMFIRPISKSIAKPTLKQRLIDIYNKAAIPASAKAAQAVITVSEYSKQDIMKNLNVDDRKVSVIKEGVNKKWKQISDAGKIGKIKEKYGITKPYILLSAAADLRKNTIRALEAFNIFNNMAEYKYQLVVTSIGKKEMATTKIPEKIRELNLDKYVTVTDYVPDEDMILLYNGGFMFLFPSIWEGFGLQVLEAFSCGLPVVTSGNTSLKEIAGDASMLIDPFSVEDIVRGMDELAKSESRRKALIEKGYEQAKRFDWKDTAAKTLEIYENLGSGK